MSQSPADARHRVPAALAWVMQTPAALHTDSWQAPRPAWEHWAVPVPDVHWAPQEVMLIVYEHTPDGADPQPCPPPAQQLPLPGPDPQSTLP